MSNAGLIYNKLYFKDENNESQINMDYFKYLNGECEIPMNLSRTIKNRNNQIKKSKILKSNLNFKNKFDDIDHQYDYYAFKLKTMYPGLLIGAGYNHEFKDNEAFKLGLSFDYTTGEAFIPGSSIKGLLRSAFPGAYEIKNSDSDIDKEMKVLKKNQRETYIKDLLMDLDIKNIDVFDLEREIFDGERAGNRIAINTRDIFFDAYLVNEGKYLDEDYITPHDDGTPNAKFKNPIPIKFLKVKPNNDIEFKFRCLDEIQIIKSDSDCKKRETIESLIKSHEKVELFSKILLDLGVGAKTNVGYGQFEGNIDLNDLLKRKEKLKNEAKKRKEEIEKKKFEEKQRLIDIENKKNMTDGEKLIYDVENKLKNSDLESKLSEINNNVYPKLDNYELLEQKKIANWLVEFWKENNKWEGDEGLSKKQKTKILKVKKFLEIQ
jgi:CRISPR-associated protein Cmr6